MMSRSRSSAPTTATAHASCPMQVCVVPNSLPSANRPSNRSSAARISSMRASACAAGAASGAPRSRVAGLAMTNEDGFDLLERGQLRDLLGFEHAAEALLERDHQGDVA